MTLDDFDKELKQQKRKKLEKTTSGKQDLPGTDTYVLLGVLAIITAFFFVGIFIGSFLMKKTRDSLELYHTFPEKFNDSTIMKVTAAQALAIVALVISLFTPILFIFLWLIGFIQLNFI